MKILHCLFLRNSAEEIEVIKKKFYHNLCDGIVEIIKMLSISQQELDKRMTCNWEVFDLMTSQQRNGQGFYVASV